LITEDKVNFILTPFSSALIAATSAIGEKYGYVTVAPMGGADFLYERGFKYLFSVFPVSSQEMIPIAEVAIQQNPKPRTFFRCFAPELTALSTFIGSVHLSMKRQKNYIKHTSPVPSRCWG
jgi:branched-chain amino acid transport system substrate-binding protein